MNTYADHDDPIIEEDEGEAQPNPYTGDEPVNQDDGEDVEDPPGFGDES
jgi:hypothetical protein